MIIGHGRWGLIVSNYPECPDSVCLLVLGYFFSNDSYKYMDSFNPYNVQLGFHISVIKFKF